MIKTLVFDDGFNEADVYFVCGKKIYKQKWTPFLMNILCKPHYTEYALHWLHFEELPDQSVLQDSYDYFDCHRIVDAPFEDEMVHFNLLYDWCISNEISQKALLGDEEE